MAPDIGQTLGYTGAFPKIYTVNGPSSTSSPTLPSWIAVKARPRTVNGHRKRTKTRHEVGQLELVQDLAFPEAAIRIKTTPDGLHAVGTGTYKPMMKVWDLEALTVKFERVTDAENVDFVFLSDDWTKTLHLQRDRSISLHTQSGLHHSVRLPTYGRSIAYHTPSAEALIGCTGTEVYRFNLDEGRYMTPLSVARGWGDGRESEVEGVNVVDVNQRHGLWSFGLDGGGGVVEFWDPRSRSALTRLVLPADTLLPVQSINTGSLLAQPEKRLGVTALSSHPSDGLSLAVGTSSGHTLLYDLRSPTSFAIKDQGYGEPMRCVQWLKGGGAQEDTGRVVSADSKVIKVWSKDDASSNQLSLHPPATLTDLHAVPSSGLMFVACDAAQLSSYYVPELGPAPKWAGFLDSITEEMADDPSERSKGAFTDFKFIDRNELDTLGLTHLIGTPALKPYMHGYFLSLKLYTTARLIANPQSYSEHRDRLVAEKLAAKAESRIRARRDQPKVNKALAERLRRAEEKEEALARRKKARLGTDAAGDDVEGEDDAVSAEKGTARTSLLQDPRFKDIWENPDFQVDEESREFALLNPATADANAAKKTAKGGRTKTAVQEEEDDSDKYSSDPDDSESDEEDEDNDDGVDDVADEADSSNDSDDGDLLQHDPRNLPESSRSRNLPASEAAKRMQQLASARQKRIAPQLVNAGNTNSAGRTFGQRLSSTSARSAGPSSAKPDGVLAMRRHIDGGMEMSFVPKTVAGADDERDEYSGGTARAERGVKSKNGEQPEKRGKKVERFGAGLEKGGVEEGEDLGTMQREGRSKRRDPGRSGTRQSDTQPPVLNTLLRHTSEPGPSRKKSASKQSTARDERYPELIWEDQSAARDERYPERMWEDRSKPLEDISVSIAALQFLPVTDSQARKHQYSRIKRLVAKYRKLPGLSQTLQQPLSYQDPGALQLAHSAHESFVESINSLALVPEIFSDPNAKRHGSSEAQDLLDSQASIRSMLVAGIKSIDEMAISPVGDPYFRQEETPDDADRIEDFWKSCHQALQVKYEEYIRCTAPRSATADLDDFWKPIYDRLLNATGSALNSLISTKSSVGSNPTKSKFSPRHQPHHMGESIGALLKAAPWLRAHRRLSKEDFTLALAAVNRFPTLSAISHAKDENSDAIDGAAEGVSTLREQEQVRELGSADYGALKTYLFQLRTYTALSNLQHDVYWWAATNVSPFTEMHIGHSVWKNAVQQGDEKDKAASDGAMYSLELLAKHAHLFDKAEEFYEDGEFYDEDFHEGEGFDDDEEETFKDKGKGPART